MAWHNVRRWTPEDEAQLRDLVKLKMSDTVIALTLERTTKSISEKVDRMGLTNQRPKAKAGSAEEFRVWSGNDLDRLRLMCQQNKTDEQIGSALVRTPGAVRSKAYSLGYRPSRSGKPAQTTVDGRIVRAGSAPAIMLAPSPAFAQPTWQPRKCQWIEGQPTPDDSCKCLKPVKEGSAYCPEHHRRCWSPRMSAAEKAMIATARF